MSFILDALKKSESDRQRQSGPALFEVKIAPPKARFPAWAIAVAALLMTNMVIVGWLLLRRASHADEITAGQAASNPVSAPAGQPSAPTDSERAANQTGAMNTSPSSIASGTSVPGPAVQPQGLTDSRPSRGADSGLSDKAPSEPTLAANGPVAANKDSTPAPGSNPDDYAPATEPGPNSPFKGHVRRGTESGYLLYQDAAVVPGANLPQLRLDLHVYAAKPQERFALINMHKLHEGDSLPEGVRVESIIPDGVVMSHNGSQFLLPRD